MSKKVSTIVLVSSIVLAGTAAVWYFKLHYDYKKSQV